MLHKGHILIVETDDLIRSLLERWLSEAGFVVGIDVPTAPPDLVIVNVASPRDAEGRIRTLEATYAAPILVVSARFRRGVGRSVELARHLGVRKILPKPFTRKELLAAVDESMAR